MRGNGLRLVNRKERHAQPWVPVGATVAEVSLYEGEDATDSIRYRESTASYTEDGQRVRRS